MKLFGFFSRRKKAKEREMLLKDTPMEKRIWMFTYPEFVEYCINNNAYVYCIKFAVSDLLKDSNFLADFERKEFNAEIARKFNNMVGYGKNKIESGGDTEFKIPEYEKINVRVYNALKALKSALDPHNDIRTARFLANEYIYDPYEDGDN